MPCLGLNPEQLQCSKISLALSSSENGLVELQQTAFANMFLNIYTYSYFYICA